MFNADQVKAVIFDLGRVLVRVDFTSGLFRYYQPQENSTDDEVLEQLFRDPLFIDFNTGKINPDQLYYNLTEKYNLTLSYAQFVFEWCNIFTPMEGMEEVVERVSSVYKCGLLSDIDPLHWQYCRKNFPFLKKFDNPALSFQIGALKPDLRCYQRAAHNTGVRPENCLFIDDREINVAGARKSGMQAIQFCGIDELNFELKKLHI